MFHLARNVQGFESKGTALSSTFASTLRFLSVILNSTFHVSSRRKAKSDEMAGVVASEAMLKEGEVERRGEGREGVGGIVQAVMRWLPE